MDDDDQLCASYIERMHERIKMFPEVEVWVPDRVGVKNRKLGLVPEKDLMFRNRVGGCSGLLIRKTIFNEIGGFDPDFPSMQDWDLWIRLLARKALYYSGESGVIYDKTSTNKITHDILAKYRGSRRLLLKHRFFWEPSSRRRHIARCQALRLIIMPKQNIFWQLKCLLMIPESMIYYMRWHKFRN